MQIVRGLLVFCLVPLLLVACGATDINDVDMADFRLGHNIVIADNATPGPLTRPANDEEIEEAVTAAINARMGHFEGDRLLHLGVAVNAYVMALPGVPMVVSPKSVLVLTVNIWDNETQQKLNDKPRQFTVFERSSPETFIGSGLTQSKAVQLENLSENAALKIQNWILDNPEWITSATGDEADLPEGNS